MAQPSHGASRTRTGDLLGAIRERLGSLGDERGRLTSSWTRAGADLRTGLPRYSPSTHQIGHVLAIGQLLADPTERCSAEVSNHLRLGVEGERLAGTRSREEPREARDPE
jgi:hypothetical protein